MPKYKAKRDFTDARGQRWNKGDEYTGSEQAKEVAQGNVEEVPADEASEQTGRE